MAFSNELAAETLGRALDELTRRWALLSSEAQKDLAALIRTHGPQIADRSYDRFNVVARVAALLDALWQVRKDLPAPVVRTLDGGQAVAASYRGITAISDPARRPAQKNGADYRLPRLR